MTFEAIKWRGGRVVGGPYTPEQLRSRQANECERLRAQWKIAQHEIGEARRRGDTASGRFAMLICDEVELRERYAKAMAEFTALKRALDGNREG
jgi:hypothetical protein